MGVLYKSLDSAQTDEQRSAAIAEVLRTNDALHILGLGYTVTQEKTAPYHGNCAIYHIGGKYFQDEPYALEDNPVFLIAVLQNHEDRKFLVLEDTDSVCMEGIFDLMHPDTKKPEPKSPYVERQE